MRILCCALLFVMVACHNKQAADLLITNAKIYTVDTAFTIAEAMVIKEGKILATGSTAALSNEFEAKEIVNANGKFIYPGFIDAHTHFFYYGQGLQTVNLVGTTSWEEILQKLKDFAATHPEGWITGRGWDQNDWPVQQFPTNVKLNELFPDRPVLIGRIDGHAAMANQRALDLAGLKPGFTIAGGKAEVQQGKLTGLLIDNAIGLVRRQVPEPTPADLKKGLLEAQQNCFAVGLTTVDDCGLDHRQTSFIDSLQQTGELKMRIYAMLSDNAANYEYLFSKGIIKTNRLHVRSFKVYGDGALGSRGACLLEPYADQPGWKGFLLSSPAHFDSVTKIIQDKGMQICTHAIGDSANRLILQLYAKHLKGKNDLRWRIEHAQVIHPLDFHFFGDYNIIPSIQPTHATSDMYWAQERLGAARVKGAYAYKQLQEQNGWIPLGTDFPVEDISPFKTFYAAVVRKDAKGWPEAGYQMENAMGREAALRGMTIWAAKANFEEKEKGSLEVGKLADFIVLDQDLLHAEPSKLLQTKVLSTWLQGEKVFNRQ